MRNWLFLLGKMGGGRGRGIAGFFVFPVFIGTCKRMEEVIMTNIWTCPRL